VKSSGFVLATRLLQKSLGFISTLILARLLMPNDFGIVAFIALTTNLFYVLSVTGNYQYLISKVSVEDDDLNTAISIDFSMKFVFWLVLIFFAPDITSYFNMTEALPALYVSSVVILIKALKNPGFVLYSKSLNYSYFFKLELSAKLISFFAVITFVLIEPSFWAIVVGDIVSAIVIMLGSYYLHSFRPKISFKKFKEQWSFSKWMFLKGSVGYAKANLDQLFVTKMFPANQLGSYYMAKDIALLPAYSIINPAADPLLPTFSSSVNNASEFRYRVSVSLLIVHIVSFPLAAYLYLFSQYLVDLLLGDNWSHISPIISNFAALMYLSCLGPILSHACVAKHKVKMIFYLDLFSLAILSLFLWYAQDYSIENLALIKGAAHFIVITSYLFYVRSISGLSLIRIMLLFVPIIISTSIGYLALVGVSQWGNEITFSYLILFSMVYFGTILLMFYIFYLRLKKVAEYQHIVGLIAKAFPKQFKVSSIYKEREKH